MFQETDEESSLQKSYNDLHQMLKEDDSAIQSVSLKGKSYDNMFRCIESLSSVYHRFELIEFASTHPKTEKLIKILINRMIETGVLRQTIQKNVVKVYTRKSSVAFAVLKNLDDGINNIILTSLISSDVNLDEITQFLKKVFFFFFLSFHCDFKE